MKKPTSIYDARPEVKAVKALADRVMNTLAGERLDRACIACLDAAVRMIRQGDPGLSVVDATARLLGIVSSMLESERTGIPKLPEPKP